MFQVMVAVVVPGTAFTDEITGGMVSTVVNDQVVGAVIGFPLASCAPLRVAV